MKTNQFNQPIGQPVDGWEGCAPPDKVVLTGLFCRVESLDFSVHTDDLFDAYHAIPDMGDWTYLARDFFESKKEFKAYIQEILTRSDAKFYAIIDLKTNKAVGLFALMRIDTKNGVVEVGNIIFSSLLKRTTASTEAQYLLMHYVFETLKYRRYEWKCDSLNKASKQAALRLGFSFEGVFRQAIVYKGRNRDTAWFSIIDSEWAQLKQSFINWLSPNNFDAEGHQIKSLKH